MKSSKIRTIKWYSCIPLAYLFTRAAVNVYVIFPYDCAALINFCLTFASVVIPQDGCCGGNYWRQRAQWSLQLMARTENSIPMCENPFYWSLMDFVNWWQNDVEIRRPLMITANYSDDLQQNIKSLLIFIIRFYYAKYPSSPHPGPRLYPWVSRA